MATNTIQNATTTKPTTEAQRASVNVMLNSVLDGEKMRNRFDELLGKRTPQFLSSLTTLINGDAALQQAFYEAPLTVIQAALKAATFDLPIEPSLGYAYIVAFNNSKKDQNGKWTKRMEATFIIGYKGMEQLCLRTGAYSRVPDAVDVRAGELIRYDRLTGDAEFKWEEDEDKRDKLPIVGYAGYFRLKNGAEKTIYMTTKQIEQHEKKFRKGDYMTKGWREDFDAMARKTVIRRLIGKYGLMSIEYRDGDPEIVRAAQEVLEGANDNLPPMIEGDGGILDADYEAVIPPYDEQTGEVLDGQTAIGE